MGSGWVVVGIVAAVVAILLAFPLLGWGLQRAKPTETTAAIGAGFEQLEALFSPGKQRELDQRRHEAEAPDEHPDSAPPRSRIDLAGRQAIIHLPQPDGERERP